MYEIHIFELRNKEINVKKILAVINATYAVAKRKPEKIRLAGIRTLTSAKILELQFSSVVLLQQSVLIVATISGSATFSNLLQRNRHRVIFPQMTRYVCETKYQNLLFEYEHSKFSVSITTVKTAVIASNTQVLYSRGAANEVLVVSSTFRSKILNGNFKL